MTVSFYIAFRLQGYAKEYAKWAMVHVHNKAKNLRIKGQRLVPHITLFGPAHTNSLRQVITEVERIGQKYTLVPFKIEGINRFDEPNKVIYLNINPSHELSQLQRELAESLVWLSTDYTEWDAKLKHKLHSTRGIFRTHENSRFEELYDYVENNCRLKNFRQRKSTTLGKLANIIKTHILGLENIERDVSQYLLRITILGKGARIQYEYDLVLKRLLSRKQALSQYWWRKTIKGMRELQWQSDGRDSN